MKGGEFEGRVARDGAGSFGDGWIYRLWGATVDLQNIWYLLGFRDICSKLGSLGSVPVLEGSWGAFWGAFG